MTVTREAAERAIGLYQSVAKSFGLTVSINKTKFMVIGSNITHEDKLSIKVEDGTIEHVGEFQYLGSVITKSGRIDEEIDRRIANASKAFGALRQAVFRNHNLSITTKQLIYRACILSVLLYIWSRVLDTIAKTHETFKYLPSSVHSFCIGHP